MLKKNIERQIQDKPKQGKKQFIMKPIKRKNKGEGRTLCHVSCAMCHVPFTISDYKIQKAFLSPKLENN